MMNDLPASDHELLDRFRQRQCEDAFRELIARHWPFVRAVARRILTDSAEADDVAQTTFIALAMRAKRLDCDRPLAPWIHTVATRAALDRRRASQRRRARETLATASAPTAPANALAARLDEAIHQLPAKLRDTLVRHYFEDRSIQEIAAYEGRSPAAIAMRLTRGRDLLRRRLRLRDATPLGVTLATAGLPSLSASPALVTAITRHARLAVAGSRFSEPALQSLVADARAALRPPLEVLLPKVLAGAAGLTLVAALPLVSLARPPEVPSPAPPSRILIFNQPAATSTSPATAAVPAEHPLLAAIKLPWSWEDAPKFVAVLDLYDTELNAIRDADGRTPLHWAVIRGHEGFAALMMHRGAQPDLPDAQGRTPLLEAATRGNENLLRLLILRHARIDHRADDGTTPLSAAVAAGDPRAVEILLWMGARLRPEGETTGWDPGWIANPDVSPAIRDLLADYHLQPGTPTPGTLPAFVRHPIHEAAARGDFPALAAYLRTAGGPNARDERGRTPLFDAIRAGQPDVVFYLLLTGADPNAADLKGRTPLSATIGWLGGDLDGMRYFLLAQGARPHATFTDGHTELTWAALRENEHGAQLLLWLGVDPRLRTRQGTAFAIAAREGNQRILDLFRRYGIDEPIVLDGPPAWRLHNATRRGDLDGIDAALAAGAAIDSLDENGNTPLIVALHKRRVPAARHLLSRGANLNFTHPKTGETPLFATSGWDFAEMTQFREEMLRAGADPNARRPGNGETILMRTVWHTPTTPLKQLVKYGADLNARDARGRSVLQRATDEGKLETAAYLRQLGARE